MLMTTNGQQRKHTSKLVKRFVEHEGVNVMQGLVLAQRYPKILCQAINVALSYIPVNNR